MVLSLGFDRQILLRGHGARNRHFGRDRRLVVIVVLLEVALTLFRLKRSRQVIGAVAGQCAERHILASVDGACGIDRRLDRRILYLFGTVASSEQQNVTRAVRRLDSLEAARHAGGGHNAAVGRRDVDELLEVLIGTPVRDERSLLDVDLRGRQHNAVARINASLDRNDAGRVQRHFRLHQIGEEGVR